MQNNAEAAVFSILPTSRSCENIRYFDQKYQPGKITCEITYKFQS